MLIKVENLQKTFKVPVRKSGTMKAISSFFKREYNYIEAIAGISFNIKAGEMVGYIGPNGAGKSTTIKILSGILVPTSGRCRVNGRIPWEERKEHVKEIGVMFGQRSQFWWDVPAGDTFQLL
ncbi:MAG: ATP-binding cassette domain-containing protein, partial [Desulfobacterales bacterium]|nr:ATP-binding cassette domain-containing protein [Desulfobacterales bacterium]